MKIEVLSQLIKRCTTVKLTSTEHFLNTSNSHILHHLFTYVTNSFLQLRKLRVRHLNPKLGFEFRLSDSKTHVLFFLFYDVTFWA